MSDVCVCCCSGLFYQECLANCIFLGSISSTSVEQEDLTVHIYVLSIPSANLKKKFLNINMTTKNKKKICTADFLLTYCQNSRAHFQVM